MGNYITRYGNKNVHQITSDFCTAYESSLSCGTLSKMQGTPTASCGGTCSPPSRCSWRSSCQLSPYYCYCLELVWEFLPSLEWPQLRLEHGGESWLRFEEPFELKEPQIPRRQEEALLEHLRLGDPGSVSASLRLPSLSPGIQH